MVTDSVKLVEILTQLMSIFNQYSFVVITIVLGLVLAFALWRWRGRSVGLRAVVMLVFIAVMAGVGLTLRYPDTSVESVQDADTLLTNGNPTFLMFYSNY